MAPTLRQNDTRPLRSNAEEEGEPSKRAVSLAALFPAARQSRPTRATAVATTTLCEGGVALPLFVVDRRLSISSVTSSVASQAVLGSSTSLESKVFVKPSGRPPRFRRNNRSGKKNNQMSDGIMSNGGPPENVVQWLESSCPNDVVPKVLAFCPPQLTSALMATNRYWFHLIARNDGTWRSLCEGLYKWKEGRDEIPLSWKEYYRLHPCVPVDYSTIPKALAVVTQKTPTANHSGTGVSQYIRSNSHTKKQQTQTIDILLRPGKHIIKESIVVAAARNVSVTLKTMELPENRFYSPRLAFAEQAYPQSYPESKPKSRKTSIGKWMSCKSASSVVDGTSSNESDVENFYDSDSSENSLLFFNAAARDSLSIQNTNRFPLATTTATSMFMPPLKYPERATIVLRTRRQNQPILLVRQGSFRLANVNLEHASHGVDIWNGNAALHVQPPLGADNEPLPVVLRPTATLDSVAISSKSGRGIVCLDGGAVTLRDCMIHDCAATGVYIGGPGSEADMSTTDVIRNGIGSRLAPSRAPRVTCGHSGVYLEQGVARIRECNISSNHLTGISAVSFDNAILILENSDLVANGNGNLEMPPPGTASHDRSEVGNANNLASVGRPCLRSNLELPARSQPRGSF